MVKKEAKLLELGRGSFIDRRVRMCQEERHRGGKLLTAVSQWETSNKARDVNFPGEEDYEVRFLSSSPQKAKHYFVVIVLFCF